MDRDKERNRILAPVFDDLEALDAEMTPEIDAVTAECETLEEKTKTAVIASGGSVKSEWLHAIYQKGRESWD